MSYQLVYLPKSGNKNYWTVDHSFTHKMKNHRFWDDPAQLIADFPVLKDQYPTVFNNRRDDRFYIYDDNDKMVVKLMEKLITTATDHGQPGLAEIPTDYGTKEYYVIRAAVADRLYYYDSAKGKNGALIAPGAGEIRFWKRQELDKAIATAQNLCRNKNFLKELPGLLPENLAVIDARTNKQVWPTQFSLTATPGQAQPTAPANDQLARVKTQLAKHFAMPSQTAILNNREEESKLPAVDLEHYNAPRVFAALSYLIEALDQRAAVNDLLEAYDQAILQDYLHTVELVNLDQLDSAAFARSLQRVRRERRKVKDLSILLNTIDDNIDQTAILKQLLGHQSLHNQYHYRNWGLGNRLLRMIGPSRSQAENN